MSRKTGSAPDNLWEKTAAVLILTVCMIALILLSGCTSAASGTGKTTSFATPASSGTLTVSPTAVPASSAVTVSKMATPSAAGTSGKTASIANPAQRIIVTNGDAAELLIAIGAKDRIVGVSDSVKTDPVLSPLFEDVESVGNWQTPNAEKILALNASTVVSYASYMPKNLDQLTAANISLLYLDCYKIDTLESDARTLGNLTGNQAGAEAYVAFLKGYEDLVQSKTASVSDARKPRVYFESYSDYSAQSGGTGSDNLIVLAGGENIASDIPVSSPKVNAEWIVSQNPDVILKAATPSKNATEITSTWVQVTNRTGMNTVTAVKTGQVYIMNSDLAYGPRAFTGLLYTAKILYPDTFRNIHPEDALDSYAGKFVPGANLSYTIYPGVG